jgi:hypothetical protein
MLSFPNVHVPGDTGPSWATVQKGIGKVLGKLSKAWDGEFAPYIKAFNKFFEPHFKTLESVSATFEKFGATADFIRFALETFGELRKRADEYMELTGSFDNALALRTMQSMSEGQIALFIRKTRLVAAMLADCDQELLRSVDELIYRTSDALERLVRLPWASRVSDNLMVGSMAQDFADLQKEYEDFPPMLQRVAVHMKSWSLDGIRREYSTELHVDARELGSKFARASQILLSRGRFGR